jgi:hypothetical protein
VSGCHAAGTATGMNAGGLVGDNFGGYVHGGGLVTNSYSIGSVTGVHSAGGLIASTLYSSVTFCYSTGTVTGEVFAGGLIGQHWYSSVTFCYSTGTVTGDNYVGGLVGSNEFGTGTVSNSFWDTETSGQVTSDGGTGKNTTEMKNIATFSAEGWDISPVGGSDERNPSYIWNIVNGVTYPFLSWQPVS